MVPSSAEAESRAIAALIRLMGGCAELRDLAGEVVTYLRGWSGCEAIGLRLHEGDDYPYFQTLGFPGPFVQRESRLCALGVNGELIRGPDGRPILECMCGNIIRGRTDPEQPFFTKGGSFWSNNTTELLATTGDEERQAHTRNFCNKSGYESVALVPIRHGGEILGLLQFNDHRPGRFSAELIQVFERFGECVGIAISQMLATRRLREGQERFRSLFEGSPDGILETAGDGRILSANPAAARILGMSQAAIVAGGYAAVFDMADPRVEAVFAKRRAEGHSQGRLRMRRGGGELFEAEVESSSYHTRGGEARIWKIFRDLSEALAAEEALRRKDEALEALARKREWLVRDSYHRVKNNLTVVESLLDLETADLADKRDEVLFTEAKGRVHAMLLIHESLHMSADLERLGSESYVRGLIAGLFAAYQGEEPSISLVSEVEDIGMDPDTALSCGLILNELISNAFKHAFAGRAKGRIGVVLRREGGELLLSVEDDGVGMAGDLDLERAGSLGLRIVQMKARELGGSISVERDGGTRFSLRFRPGRTP
ncbi:MAG TPA: histidine kinase dimerization/phosphoacceptor domain -containing protein [Rectinemataceae bacterium]|nr:histidine kinase dimerization/phosphoacceptor domain -containing protein [Rectinemataceae bacterium]